MTATAITAPGRVLTGAVVSLSDDGRTVYVTLPSGDAKLVLLGCPIMTSTSARIAQGQTKRGRV